MHSKTTAWAFYSVPARLRIPGKGSSQEGATSRLIFPTKFQKSHTLSLAAPWPGSAAMSMCITAWLPKFVPENSPCVPRPGILGWFPVPLSQLLSPSSTCRSPSQITRALACTAPHWLLPDVISLEGRVMRAEGHPWSLPAASQEPVCSARRPRDHSAEPWPLPSRPASHPGASHSSESSPGSWSF